MPIILNADPDPAGKMNTDPSGSGSTALVATQLVNHLEINELLYKHQYGFL